MARRRHLHDPGGRSQSRQRRAHHQEPKSHQIRIVSVDTQTAELLREHQTAQVEMARSVEAKIASDAFVLADILTDASGSTPIRPDRLTQAFARLCQRVEGAEGVRLHDLRHWFASTQLDAGEPLPAVAARIGDNVETLATKVSGATPLLPQRLQICSNDVRISNPRPDRGTSSMT